MNKISHLTAALQVLAVMALAVENGYAGANSSGGGDAAILTDDTVILADPFAQHLGNRFELPILLRQELLRVDHLLARIGAATLTGGQHTRFIHENVLSDLIEYRATSNLPVHCERIPMGSLPAGATVTQVACTEGPITWVVQDLFKKMSVREQAKLIVHERMRALQASPPHEFIADVTTGLEAALSLYNRQMQGERPLATPQQVADLNTLVRRIVQTGLNDGGPTFYRAGVTSDVDGNELYLKNWKVSATGGGLVNVNALVADTAYVGIASVLGSGTRMEAKSEVLDVDCSTGSCTLDEGAVFQSSLISERGEGSRLWAYQEGPRVHLGPNARIINSIISTNLLLISGPGAQILDSSISAVQIVTRGKIEKVKTSGFDLLVGASEFRDSVVSASSGRSGLLIPDFTNVSNLIAEDVLIQKNWSHLAQAIGFNFVTVPATLGLITLVPGLDPFGWADDADASLLIFKQGVSFEFEKGPVCTSQQRPKLLVRGHKTIKSPADLSKLCRKAK